MEAARTCALMECSRCGIATTISAESTCLPIRTAMEGLAVHSRLMVVTSEAPGVVFMRGRVHGAGPRHPGHNSSFRRLL
jgi:hypothetical protein